MPQPDLYFVRLDLAEVRRAAARLSATDGGNGAAADHGAVVDNDAVVDWLLAHGFLLARGGWYAAPAALDLMHPAAIRYCEPVRGA